MDFTDVSRSSDVFLVTEVSYDLGCLVSDLGTTSFSFLSGDVLLITFVSGDDFLLLLGVSGDDVLFLS